MKQHKIFRVLAGALVLPAMVLFFGACSGKTQTSSGGDSAAELKEAAGAAKDALKSTAKTAAGAAKDAVKSTGNAAAGKPAEASDFVYGLNKAKNGVIISDVRDDAKFGAHLVVPAEIEGFPVVAFLANSRLNLGDFNARKNKRPPLESVVLPDSITYMGKFGIDGKYHEYGTHEDYGRGSKYEYDSHSFRDCESLKRIVFPKNVKMVPPIWVTKTDSIKSLKSIDITWPEALEIWTGFQNDDSITELVIPNGVKVINSGSFSTMKSLTTVTIPDSVEVILNEAFNDCPQLSTVNVPAHAITYGPQAFSNCPRLGIAAQKAIKDTGYTGTFK
ncbi:hypothetical protein FACS189473_4310 [Spirochaetia bacterium]|nr:hypothetical protein FACS189473_4310 [Spirochaetia bacterium]